MSTHKCLVRHADKHTSNKVLSVCWSEAIDLAAVCMEGGILSLYRLSMQCVWTIDHKQACVVCNNSSNPVEVKSVCWKPDGKLLFIGYSCGLAGLFEIERGSIVHLLRCSPDSGHEQPIFGTKDICLPVIHTKWFQTEHDLENAIPTASASPDQYDSISQSDSYTSAFTYIEQKQLTSISKLNILVLFDTSGFYGYGLGIVPLFHISTDSIPREDVLCSDSVDEPLIVTPLSEDANDSTDRDIDNRPSYLSLSSSVSEDSSGKIQHDKADLTHENLVESLGCTEMYMDPKVTMFVAVTSRSGSENNARVTVFSLESLFQEDDSFDMPRRLPAVKILALFNCFLELLQKAMVRLSEIYRDSLRGCDDVLSNYGTDNYLLELPLLSFELRRLLLFGTASEDFEQFLLYKLTDRGLKTIRQTLTTQYTHMKAHIEAGLINTCTNVIDLLFTLLPFVSEEDFYSQSTDPNQSSASLLLKRVIADVIRLRIAFHYIISLLTKCQTKYEPFFDWLETTIGVLSGDSNVSKLKTDGLTTSVQRKYILEAIKLAELKRPRDMYDFRLEKFGIFFEDFSSFVDESDWVQFANSVEHDASPFVVAPFAQNETGILGLFDNVVNKLTDFGHVFCRSSDVRVSYSLHIDAGELLESQVSTLPVSLPVFSTCRLLCCYKSFHNPAAVELLALSQKKHFHFSSVISEADSNLIGLKWLERASSVSRFSEQPFNLLSMHSTNSGFKFLVTSFTFPRTRNKRSPISVASTADECEPSFEDIGFNSFSISSPRNILSILYSSGRRVQVFLIEDYDEDEEQSSTEIPVDNSTANSAVPTM